MCPLDDHARDGAYHLLLADDGTHHCARWDGEGWTYSSTARVQPRIIRYFPRPASAGRNRPKGR